MKKLLMLKGLPGSGKSTWANTFVEQNSDWVRLNKDSLRLMIKHERWVKNLEKSVIWIRDTLTTHFLGLGYSVIIDDTNFDPKHEATLRQIANIAGAEFEIKFFDVSLADCIKNDLNRPKSVGQKVIRRMWSQYLAPRITPPAYDLDLPNAVICDIDGTIAIHVARGPYDMEKCDTDERDTVVLGLLYDVLHSGHQVIFITGREDKYREMTLTWMLRQCIPHQKELLFMRPTGDHRDDVIIKQEIYDREIKGKYNVLYVLDDRNRVVDMWRRNGLKCLQVADGDF